MSTLQISFDCARTWLYSAPRLILRQQGLQGVWRAPHRARENPASLKAASVELPAVVYLTFASAKSGSFSCYFTGSSSFCSLQLCRVVCMLELQGVGSGDTWVLPQPEPLGPGC